MIKYLYPLVFITLFTSLSAQQFVSLENTWMTSEGWFNPSGGHFIGAQYMYKFMNTIEINGTEYMELYRAEEPDFDEFELYDTYTQDGQKVYKYSSTGDILLYDFGLMIGDTVDIVAEMTYVAKIDSVQMDDGTMRKRMELKVVDVPHTSIMVIAGMGADRNFLSPNPFPIADVRFSTDCFSENDIVLYSSDYANCTSDISSSTEINEKAYNLTYHGDHFRLDGQSSLALKLGIYTLSGELVQMTTIDQNVFRLNSRLPDGLVIAQLISDNNQVSTQLISVF